MHGTLIDFSLKFIGLLIILTITQRSPNMSLITSFLSSRYLLAGYRFDTEIMWIWETPREAGDVIPS